jgi:hypothetical protein
MSTYLSMTRGDDESFDVHVVDRDGVDVDLSGADLRFTAKRDVTDADVDAVITKTLTGAVSDGITIVTAVEGLARIDIDDTDTDALTRGTLLVWDLQVVDSTDKVRTVASGTLRIIVDVSRTAP